MSAAARGAVLRAFRRPRLWLGIGALGLLVLVGLALLPARGLPPAPFSGFDKFGHFLGYAALSAYAGMLFARMRAQTWAAAGLVALGFALEFAQAQLTDSRSGELRDAVANTAGVLAGLVSARASPRWAGLLQRLDARLP
ncbi:VanZ family protein [Lysobacter koreensis]|uniref:VanZ family protein n=1 Tax=Lysobacter koreensis TaxID=266122 RepID=A0ABW2YPE2_9GAMM